MVKGEDQTVSTVQIGVRSVCERRVRCTQCRGHYLAGADVPNCVHVSDTSQDIGECYRSHVAAADG